jgi:hypothetical protein
MAIACRLLTREPLKLKRVKRGAAFARFRAFSSIPKSASSPEFASHASDIQQP